MWIEKTFVPDDQDMAMTASEEMGSERGAEGIISRFSDATTARRAVITVLAKLPAVDSDGRGIDATSMDDAFAQGITWMFDLTAPDRDRTQWRADNSEYLDRHGSGADWQQRGLVIDGRVHSAHYLTYGNACAYVTDTGDTFLIAAFTPVSDEPRLRTRDQSEHGGAIRHDTNTD